MRERVLHRVGHRGRSRDRAALAHALGAERRDRRRVLEPVDLDGGHVGRGGLEVVHEGRREELARLVVAELLEQRGADAVHGRAVDHALDDQGVELPPAVVHHARTSQELDPPGARVDLDQAAVGRVGEDQLRAHPPVCVERLGQRVLVDVVGLQARGPGRAAGRAASA